MSKYLYISGGDYAALSFEQDFDGNKLALWEVANHAGKEQQFELDDLYFTYKALELDDETVDQIQDNMDYDDSKHANYYKVEEE